MGRKQRLDLLLVELGLVASRHQAQQLIRAGRVRLQGRVLDKPGLELDKELVPELEALPRFVSRGGEKLAAALLAFPLALPGRICLDAGISTGGFTDCLLQSGAARVYGIDVGYGQTAWSLRSDERVVLRERTNLRHLDPADLYGPEDPWPDFGVADLSFIALARVLPALRGLLRSDGAEAVVLVKPQFEVGRERVGKGGVVRDPRAHVDAILAVMAAAIPCGWQAAGLVASPLTGPAGNHEYLLWLQPPNSDWSRKSAAEPARVAELLPSGGSSPSAEHAPDAEPSSNADHAPNVDGSPPVNCQERAVAMVGGPLERAGIERVVKSALA
ncbi:TlyA family RNA methyltransferase [Synechococcus sp. ATX 2A4]|nr:TlyA family RNA methyltransferase [Synechococcus sp. ATX 2A4]